VRGGQVALRATFELDPDGHERGAETSGPSATDRYLLLTRLTTNGHCVDSVRSVDERGPGSEPWELGASGVLHDSAMAEELNCAGI
jgi:hypothetical protein